MIEVLQGLGLGRGPHLRTAIQTIEMGAVLKTLIQVTIWGVTAVGIEGVLEVVTVGAEIVVVALTHQEDVGTMVGRGVEVEKGLLTLHIEGDEFSNLISITTANL